MTPYFPLSWVGGLCNGKATVENDPHLTGAHGTHFDFTGRLDKAFCLLTDARVHINMLLNGYQGTPPAVAARATTAAPEATGTSLHTWIKEVGVVWVSTAGKQHSLRMVARKGNQQERGASGFLALLQVDGADMAPPRLMDEMVEAEGGLVVSKVAEGREGPFDVDRYTVTIEGVGELDVRMRVAHPLLQTPDEAEAHFNIALTDIVTTPLVHGVLGQTFRDTPEQQSRALRYTHLSSLLHHPIAADTEEGRGFLDGAVDDYVSSGITAPDCRFSSFGRQAVDATAAGAAGAGAAGSGGADGESAGEDLLASVV
ncbi:hypothetical protein CLOM_g19980 [Closterium sp. NIES-68]|nr:hypothetical protein CLOM_g19980 [Closterium sp. NIES-68]GJP67176.1 hypothetical protein CLOP_g24032 [Closterium sp. NIES-67]